MHSNFKGLGFTLVELMVTIVIIGLLVAVGVPSYRQYVIQSSVATAIAALDASKKDLIAEYNVRGAWPATLKTQGVSISAGGSAEFLDSKIDTIAYNRDTANNVAWLEIYISDEIGATISGFAPVSSVGQTGGAKNARIVMGFKLDSQDAVQTYCGRLEVGDTDVPQNLLPTGCNYEDIQAEYLLSN